MNKQNSKFNYRPFVSGLILLIGAVIMVVVYRCPTKVQYFVIYALVGTSLSLFFPKSAEQAVLKTSDDNISFTVIGSIAISLILIFLNPIRKYGPDDCDFHLKQIAVTVFVYDAKKGTQYMILRQKGFVIMDVRGERKRSSINENGQAYFQNLTIGDSVKIEIDFSEPYHSVKPDSLFVIPASGAIDLPVYLKGIDRVYGMALYKDQALSGVLVKLSSPSGKLFDTTDNNGDFEFVIPDSLQAKEYQVRFSKKGFTPQNVMSIPQLGQPLNVQMEH